MRTLTRSSSPRGHDGRRPAAPRWYDAVNRVLQRLGFGRPLPPAAMPPAGRGPTPSADHPAQRGGFDNGPAAAVVLLAALAFAAPACTRDEAPAAAPGAAAPAPAERRGDAEIATAVQASFHADPEVRSVDIDVSAENGVVTLRGRVPDAGVRQRAAAAAQQVPGVDRVVDQIEIGAESAARAVDEAEPAWITTKIQAQYFLDSDVRPWNIDVTTMRGGAVTLAGSVGSAEAKREAVRIARETEGVTRVDDRLRIAPDAAGASPTAEAAAAIDDAWLSAKIRAKYFVDEDVKARAIDVAVQNGVVTLRGTVASEAVKREAVALARNTDGVRAVKDELTVGAAEEPTALSRPDAWLTTTVQAQFFLDPEIKGHQIDVDTRSGVVTLRGYVDTAAQKESAERIARDTEGVVRVVNQLTVGPAR